MVKASDFVVDSIHYNILSASDKTVEVTYAPDYKYSGDIVIPATVKLGTNELKVVAIGANAFSKCKDLTSVTLGDNVENIGKEAFYACVGLKEVSLVGKIKIIGSCAFQKCSGLRKLEIPGNVELIESWAFDDCSGLTQLVIYNGVKTISAYAFDGNGKITEVSIPASVENMGRCFYFYPNTGIKVLRFEDGDTEIAASSPWAYSNLDKFYLGRNFVDSYWSWGIITAKEITIGSKVKKLNWEACNQLETINLHCTNPPISNIFTESQYAMVTVNVPQGCLEAYQKAEPWCNFWNIKDCLPTAINQTQVDKDEVEAVFSIDGVRCTMSDKGVLIVKMKSGKTMKVIK